MDVAFANELQNRRKRLLSLITSVVVIIVILIDARQQNPAVPLYQKPYPTVLFETFSTSDDIIELAAAIQLLKENLWKRIIALHQYSSDPTRKSGQPFWDVYSGSDDLWYKEYRMSRETFNGVVRDSVPFLYTRPTYSLKSARHRYLRAKVVMTTLV